ncbi:hypothetical protein AB0K68_53895, partial [Streptomyces sp. NPDC050698]
MKLLEMLTLPLRAGIAAAEISLGIAELTVTTVRIAVGNTGAVTAGAAGLASPRGPMQMIQQLSSLTADDRPIGQALAPGGPLDRLLSPGGPVDKLT